MHAWRESPWAAGVNTTSEGRGNGVKRQGMETTGRAAIPPLGAFGGVLFKEWGQKGLYSLLL